MKNNNFVTALPAARRWFVPASIVGALLVSCLVVQGAVAGGSRHKDKKTIIEMSGQHGAFLGILMQELTDEVLQGLNTDTRRGVLVTEVIDDSPADKAGIEEGDIIVELMGKRVSSPDELRERIAGRDVGDEIKVKLMRGKRSKTMKVTLGDWADQPAMAWIEPDDLYGHWDKAMNYVSNLWPRRLGVRVSKINDDLGAYFGVKEGEGVLVLGVEDDSTAEELGVKAGDVIVEVEGEEIHSAGDIRESLSELDKGDEVNVKILRKKKNVELKAELKESSHTTWFYNFRDHAPRVRAFTVPEADYGDELRKELEELRKEFEELKKELKKS